MARIVLHDREVKLRDMLMKTDNMRRQITANVAHLLLGAGLMTFGLPASAISIYSETFTPNTGTQSDAGISVMLASDFKSLSGGTITEVAWQGIYLWDGTPQALDNFTINFYADSAGNVGASIYSFNVGSSANRHATGDSFSGEDFYGYTANIGAGITVDADTAYWISIVNDTTSDVGDNWFWATNTNLIGPGNAASVSNDGGETWVSRTDAGSYYVALSGNVSAVPLPPAFALLLPGLALLGFMTRRGKVP